MPKYKVTQTATAEVWGKSEDEVIELVSGEFFAFPEYTHEVQRLTPTHVATLEEIADLLTKMGKPSKVVDFGRYEGQPKVVEIGESVSFYAEGQPFELPAFTLYQHLKDDGTISGMGYHLSWQDDESILVNENIGNLSALEVVGQILYDMGRADFDHETQEGRNA